MWDSKWKTKLLDFLDKRIRLSFKNLYREEYNYRLGMRKTNKMVTEFKNEVMRMYKKK